MTIRSLLRRFQDACRERVGGPPPGPSDLTRAKALRLAELSRTGAFDRSGVLRRVVDWREFDGNVYTPAEDRARAS